MTAVWVTIEHLPTRKRMVRFDGTNGAEIARLVGDPTLVTWDGIDLLVVNDHKAEFRVEPGDPIVFEEDLSSAYPVPQFRIDQQYREVK